MERKPIGITVPYRKAGVVEEERMAKLESQVAMLAKRIRQLEKLYAQKK